MENFGDFVQSSKTDSIKRNLNFSFHESSPVVKCKSRKRKSLSQDSIYQTTEVLNTTQDSYHSLSSSSILNYDSCLSESYSSNEYRSSYSQNNQSFSCNYDLSFDINHVMVSSPLDKNNETVKLGNSLEKCSLLDFDSSSKRIKWDYESPNGKRKSNSAPGTPQHPGKAI